MGKAIKLILIHRKEDIVKGLQEVSGIGRQIKESDHTSCCTLDDLYALVTVEVVTQNNRSEVGVELIPMLAEKNHNFTEDGCI